MSTSLLPAGERTELITFQRFTTTEDEYGQPIETWTDFTTRRARVRFGLAQEQRQAAQESASQTATFECIRSGQLDGITNKDRIVYLGDNWDINETAPLGRATIRFTAIRLAS